MGDRRLTRRVHAVRPARSLWFLLAFSLVAGCAAAGTAPGAPDPARAAATELTGEPYDLVILGGRIVDGTGSPWFHGDLAVRGDRIARIAPAGLLEESPARKRIDAAGLMVAPGFIDIQSHSRRDFLGGDGRVVSKVTQGITTEILGEGWTNAPQNERTRSFAGSLDPASAADDHDFSGPRGFAAWLEAMEAHGASPNFGSYVGATTLRAYAMGGAMRSPTAAELDTMKAVLARAMEDGAFGLATALIYPPGSYATTEELIAVSRAMAPYGGVYITHMRSEGDELLEALEEAIRIGAEADVPVEVYHLKAAGRRNWDLMPRAIALIDSARRTGLDVQANMYPYTAGGTGLTAILPPWASADGRLLDNLRDPEIRRRIRADMLQERGDWENLGMLAGPEGMLVLGLEKSENRPWIGRRLSEVAAEMGVDWADAAIELILSEEQRIGTIFFLMSEQNLALQFRQPWIKIGTDAGGFDPDTASGPAHPRAYGTYPRILGRYVRELGVLELEDAVRKMTSAVAARLSLHDRGVLRPGAFADIVVLDPETVGDRATFERPHQLSVGIRHVLVNGVPVLEDGRHTGALPGRIVRGPGWRGPAAGPPSSRDRTAPEELAHEKPH